MKIFQQFYMCILNPIGFLTIRINEKIRNGIIGACFCGMIIMCYLAQMPSVPTCMDTETKRMLIGAVLTFLIIVMSMKEKLQYVKWKKSILASFLIWGGIILIASIDHFTGKGIIGLAIMILAEFPALYFVWNNRRDYEVLYAILSKCVVAAMILYFFICLWFVPFDETTAEGMRYQATTHNPNRLAMFSIGTTVGALYLILSWKNLLGKAVCAWSVGISIAFSWLAASRSSLLSIAMLLVLFLWFYIRNSFMGKRERLLEKQIMLAISCVIVIMMAFVSVQLLDQTNEPFKNRYFNQIAYSESTQEHASGSMSEGDSVMHYAMDRFHSDSGDLNGFSSGRLGLWKESLQHLTWFGNSVWIPLFVDRETGYEWMHNTVLDFTYRAGIFAGIAILVLGVFLFLFVFQKIFSVKKLKPGIIFSVLAICAYGFWSQIEIAIFPFERLPVLLYFLALAPVWDCREWGIK